MFSNEIKWETSNRNILRKSLNYLVTKQVPMVIIKGKYGKNRSKKLEGKFESTLN